MLPVTTRDLEPDPSLEDLDDIDGIVDDKWREAVLLLEGNSAPSVSKSRQSQGLRTAIVGIKGGSGSGDFGHAGRPGEVGGSSGKGNKLFPDGAVVNTEDAVLAVLKKINSNPEMHRYVVAVECDSGVSAGDDLGYIPIPGLEAVTWEGPEGNMGEYEVRNEAVYTEISDEITKISEDCEKATAWGSGWWDPDDDASTKERQEWEKRMYGKVIGGHNKSYAYGSDMVKNYVKSILGNIKVIKPKKAKKKLTDPRDIFYNKYDIGKKVKHGDSVWEVFSHMGWGKSDEHAVVMRNSGRERVVTISGTVFDVPTGKHYWDYKPRPKANKEKIVITKGGTESGFHGHSGRPGKVGGSSPQGTRGGYRNFGSSDTSRMSNYIDAHSGVESYSFRQDYPAVEWYTGTGYVEINGILRNGKSISDDHVYAESNLTMKEAIEQMDEFTQQGTIPEDTLMYRGFRPDTFPSTDILKGKTIIDKGYASASLDEKTALSAAGYNSSNKKWHGCIAEIRVNKGHKVGMVMSTEYEIIFPRGTKFKVLDVIKTHVPMSMLMPAYDEIRLVLEAIE